MSYVGKKCTQFSVNYDTVCGCDLLLPLCDVLFYPENNRACSLVLLAKRKGQEMKALNVLKCKMIGGGEGNVFSAHKPPCDLLKRNEIG